MTDPRALRALAHPTRIALLEALALHGSLTATEASAIVGGSVPNVAYHLRTLASHEYVVEAEGGGGRERPWKLAGVGMAMDGDDPDPATAHAARALGDVMVDRWLDRIRTARSRRDQHPAELRALSGESHIVLFATPAEIKETQDEVRDILMRFMDRIGDPALRPEGTVPFDVLMFSYPIDDPGPNPVASPKPNPRPGPGDSADPSDPTDPEPEG